MQTLTSIAPINIEDLTYFEQKAAFLKDVKLY